MAIFPFTRASYKISFRFSPHEHPVLGLLHTRPTNGLLLLRLGGLSVPPYQDKLGKVPWYPRFILIALIGPAPLEENMNPLIFWYQPLIYT